jgi:hypothetical protein
VLTLSDHLIASADNQSVETKPRTRLNPGPGERSQGRPAMDVREEARLHGRIGERLGWHRGRAPVASAKSVLPAPIREDPAVANAVTDSASMLVEPAVMSGIQLDHITDEVPRRLLPHREVTASYKQAVKGSPDASATGTPSQRPCPRGCQQRQSSPATRDERQNRSRSTLPRTVFGKVSMTTTATKWPARTSSWQPVTPLRNIPRYGSGPGGQNLTVRDSHVRVCS